MPEMFFAPLFSSPFRKNAKEMTYFWEPFIFCFYMYSTEQFISIIQKAIEAVAYPEAPAELYNPIRYELSLGGKRIRPVLALLSCDLLRRRLPPNHRRSAGHRDIPQLHPAARRCNGQGRHAARQAYRACEVGREYRHSLGRRHANHGLHVHHEVAGREPVRR